MMYFFKSENVESLIFAIQCVLSEPENALKKKMSAFNKTKYIYNKNNFLKTYILSALNQIKSYVFLSTELRRKIRKLVVDFFLPPFKI